jgi:SAM-dependent methyltransferase
MATVLHPSIAGRAAQRDPNCNRTLRALLDHTAEQLRADNLAHLDEVVDFLNAVRLSRSAAEWQELIADVIAPHEARALLHEEPFTRRAFEKPRGYPGDAPMLDLIYRAQPDDGAMTALGARLHAWAGTHAGCRSVRERRDILAALYDRIAAERPSPRILSLACGHLREAQCSRAVGEGAISEIVAVDQDQLSLDLIAREQAAAPITAVCSSIRRLLVEPMVYGSFDLAYAAGLYDYLAEPVAQRLTASMFRALRPGGTLLVANFAPNLREIGYMEAIMDWVLIYRNEIDVDRFAADIPRAEVADLSITRDSGANVVYLTIRKC